MRQTRNTEGESGRRARTKFRNRKGENGTREHCGNVAGKEPKKNGVKTWKREELAGIAVGEGAKKLGPIFYQ